MSETTVSVITEFTCRDCGMYFPEQEHVAELTDDTVRLACPSCGGGEQVVDLPPSLTAMGYHGA